MTRIPALTQQHRRALIAMAVFLPVFVLGLLSGDAGSFGTGVGVGLGVAYLMLWVHDIDPRTLSEATR